MEIGDMQVFRKYMKEQSADIYVRSRFIRKNE
jgi:hypothetical protein